MGCEVYANSNEIACKAGGGKVIAAFPDVCLTPPSPPAGPIPVPYPDTSFSKDMKNGSKSVKIKNKEVMLKDKSFYKSSPLGDEAATKSLGAGVVTHVITGKTYFQAWSMDVKFEGKNVDRHIDPTTSNHASMIGNVMAPMVNLAIMALAFIRKLRGKCECCGKEPHSKGDQVSMDDWYTQDNAGNPMPAAKNGFTTNAGDNRRGYDAVIKDAKNKKNLTPPCTCDGKVIPKSPCNKFYQKITSTEKTKINTDYRAEARVGDGPGTLRHRIGAKSGEKVNHLTPKCGGGCATGRGNLQPDVPLCGVCKGLDKEFEHLQNYKDRF